MTIETIEEAALSEQVQRFYDRARQDELLGPVFERAIQDWPPHIATITSFWAQAMLGGDRYRGNAFAKHLDKGIEPPMFERWLRLWSETAREIFAEAPATRLIERAELIGRSLMSGLFFARGPAPQDV